MTSNYEELLETLNNLIVSEDMLSECIREVIAALRKYDHRVKSSRSLVGDGDELGQALLDIVEGAYKLEHDRYKAMSAQRHAIGEQIERVYKMLGKLDDPQADPEDSDPCKSCRRPYRVDHQLQAPYRDCIGCKHYVNPAEEFPEYHECERVYL